MKVFYELKFSGHRLRLSLIPSCDFLRCFAYVFMEMPINLLAIFVAVAHKATGLALLHRCLEIATAFTALRIEPEFA